MRPQTADKPAILAGFTFLESLYSLSSDAFLLKL